MLKAAVFLASIIFLANFDFARSEQENASVVVYKIDGGDGDQSFFRSPHRLRMVSKDWFPGHLPRGKAFLFEIVNEGEYTGQFVATTSRVLMPLEDQLRERDMASVVVHLITNPTHSFSGTSEDAFPVGMSVLEVVRD